MLNVSTPHISTSQAPVHFSGKKDGRYKINTSPANPGKKATRRMEKSAERKQKIKNALGLAKVGGIFTLAAGALATSMSMVYGGATWISEEARLNALSHSLPALQPTFQVKSPDTTGLTNVGKSVYGDDGAKVTSTHDTLKALDESYALIIHETSKFAEMEISPSDLAKRIDILESKKPQVDALIQKLYDEDKLGDPEALFNGLSEIFKDDLTPEQQERYREAVEKLMGNELTKFAESRAGGGVFLGGILAAVGLASLGASQEKKRREKRRWDY